MTNETLASQTAHDVALPAEMEQPRVQEMPSTAVEPPSGTAGADMPLQQGDGSEVPMDQTKKPTEVSRDDQNLNTAELPSHSPTFKEQVYGYARLIRGTMLGKPGVKEQGVQVLRGEQGIPERRGSQSSK